MKRSIAFTLIPLVFIAAVGLSSCGDDCGDDPTGPDCPQLATTITLSNSSVTLDALGATDQITATVKDQNGATMLGESVTWSSSDAQVASVSSSGLVTAVGNGFANITATSGSASARASASVAQVAASITLSPDAVSFVSLGDTVTLTASVLDAGGQAVEGAEVTWSSSDASVATVDTSGLVTAQANGTTTLTATSGSVSDQASLTVQQAVTTVEITPGSAELIVNQTVLLDLEAQDRNGHEVADSIATRTWSSLTPSVASVSASGSVRGLVAGSAQIEASVVGVVATVTIIVTEASTPEVETGSVTGAVEIPASVDSTAVWVYSGVSGAATVAPDGSFASETAVDHEGALIAMHGDRLLGLSIRPPSGSASAASPVTVEATGVRIDPRSSALALVFLTPLFAAAPPEITQEILDLIDGLAEIDALEDAIRALIEATGGMPDENDAAFVSAYVAAVQAAHDAMAARAGVSSQELVQLLLVPDQDESGVKLDFPDGDATAGMTVMVQNVYGRDVDVYLTEADAEGNPRADLSNLGNYYDHRVLQLPPADYVPDITSIGEWIDLWEGKYGPDDPTPLLLTFTTANPRYLLFAYGPGVSGLGSDLAAIEGSEDWRWVVPSAFTATFSFVLPIIEAAGGFKFLPKMKLGSGYVDLRLVADVLAEAVEALHCMGDGSDQADVVICLGGEMQSFLVSHPVELASLIQKAAVAAGLNLATSTIDGVLNNVIPVVKLVSLASTLGDMFVTSYAIGVSELRQEFDLSYNGLLGASDLQPVSGDNQEANRGHALGDPLVVKAVDASGNAMPNAWVEWEAVSGGGSHCACSGSTVEVTDENGLSSVSWTLGEDGQQQLRARLAGFAETAVTFSASFPVPSQLEAVADSVSGQPGSTVEVGARVLTGAGVPVAGHEVVFTLATGHGLLSGSTSQTVTTDSDGTAEVTWTLPDAEGTYQLSVVAQHEGSDLDGSPLTITATVSEGGGLGIGFGSEQFALIPAGTFQMGDAVGNGRDVELPVHTVNLTQSFYIQKTEVTQAQWQAVMGSNPSYFSTCGDLCPVEQVNWDDIQTFITTLNAQDPGKNYRLPTEAEWEYAARAGTTGDYGGTGVLDDMGWYEDNSNSTTHPVALKLANAWDLYDMHGNVAEWVQDWFSGTYYSVSPTNDPQGPATTRTWRVFRGGSWGSLAAMARSANRGGFSPSRRYSSLGFRLALSIEVYAGLSITTTSLADGVMGAAYSQTLTATGGDGTYTWSISAGSLPAGLSLSAAGVISGTPTTAGRSDFTVQVASGGLTDPQELSITIGGTSLGIGFGDEQFALIPSGTFQMGDITGNGEPHELPVHTVNLTQSFYLQKTEVTQGQWRAVMGSNPSGFSSCGDTCPVETVSWEDVQTFLATLNALDPGKDYRLPTEAEWEYAARAGTTGDYGGTGVLDDMGWYEDNSGSATHPAAQKVPNAWDLYDMHGNVWEWVQDWYLSIYYSRSPTNDPQGPATMVTYYRVLRGGTWSREASAARSAYRGSLPPSAGWSRVGFRLARTP